VSLIFTGREIRTLVEEELKAGYYTLAWDGRDHDGKTVSSGIYFTRMVSGSFNSTRKTVLLR